MKAVGYVRVSRAEEKPENQEYVIREYCSQHGLECLVFPPEIEVSRLENPFQRPVFRQIIEFMEKNNIRILVVESIDRLTAEPEHWEEIIKFFTERGWRIIFVKDKDITKAFETAISILENIKRTADSEVVRQTIEQQQELLKMQIKYYWRIKVAVAKEYVEDVKRKTRRALERLRNAGRIYTKPTLPQYYALFLYRKSSFRDLTPEEIRSAEKLFYDRYVKPYLEGVPIRKLWRKFLEEEKPFIEFLTIRARKRKTEDKNTNTYLAYTTFYTNVKRLAEKMKTR